METRVSFLKSGSLASGLVLSALLTASASRAAEPTKQECISANESAQALRQAGKLRDARSTLSVCMASSCPGPVREDCGQRLEDLQSAIPTVVFDIKDAAGRDLLGVQVSIDGNAPAAAGVTAVPLDPGPHAFHFEAAGAPPVDESLVLREGERDRRVSVVIGSPSATTPTAPPVEPESKGAPVEAPPPQGEQASAASAGDTQRLAGWITGGAGVAAMGAGIVVGLAAKSSYDGASGCSGTTCTSTTGFNTSKSAIGTGNAATGIFVVGALATAAGVVLWLTAPKAASTGAGGSTLNLGLTLGGAMARGTF
jgi:hypothetical protein